jgi:hypothetical protein
LAAACRASDEQVGSKLVHQVDRFSLAGEGEDVIAFAAKRFG